MGGYVAEAIAGLIAGQQPKPFRFVTRGRLALLGHRTGVEVSWARLRWSPGLAALARLLPEHDPGVA